MDLTDEARIMEVLDAKAVELRQQLGELTRPVEDGATIGFGKRIGDGTTQAIQQLTDASSAQDLASLLEQVVRARAKVDYGSCDVCAEPIPAARLQFRPWSIECVEHA
ncbi:MAG: TraR/DksA family transcriptional regulator [Brooklawnia sp.]|jgi:DnaK suppressor protein